MNREIKFRAWIKESKQMVTVNAITFMSGGGYSIIPAPYDATKAIPIGESLGVETGNVLMQYTGLKDKNGREIYEGDIIDYGYKKSVIVWYQSGWCSAGINEKCCESNYFGKSPYQVYLEGGHCVEMDSVLGFHHTPKLIGHIYENPDLLTNNN